MYRSIRKHVGVPSPAPNVHVLLALLRPDYVLSRNGWMWRSWSESAGSIHMRREQRGTCLRRCVGEIKSGWKPSLSNNALAVHEHISRRCIPTISPQGSKAPAVSLCSTIEFPITIQGDCEDEGTLAGHHRIPSNVATTAGLLECESQK